MPKSIADLRLDNALVLYSDFMRARLGRAIDPRQATLEAPFAKQLRISASYWSQLKSRNRQIGEKLARQFDRLCDKPPGWLDTDHASEPADVNLAPGTDDERFLVGMLLTCYRINPIGVKQRLLELLEGELAKARAPAARKQHGAKSATNGS